MATTKQKKALNKMVENGGNTGQAMIEAGYSSNTAKTPQKLTESKGYKAILADCGLTESLIVNNLVADIQKKPERRLGELTLASDILGMRKKGLVIEDKTEKKYTPEDEETLREIADVINAYYNAKESGRDSVIIKFKDHILNKKEKSYQERIEEKFAGVNYF